MTSKHDGFEGFEDFEPEMREMIDEQVYEGIVQHACQEAMTEMVEIGKMTELITMFLELLPIENKGNHDSARTRNDVEVVRG
tara:strand:+ start:450 stop:695 length:246 start_codon:yes stop_codon:yes gene_type:complete